MATSGTVYSSKAKSSCLYVKWYDDGQSTSGNYTTIKWSAGISNGNDWYSNAVKITSVYINGTKVSSGGTYSNITSNKTYEKLSGSIKVPHNADGTKKITVSIYGWFYDYGDKSGSKEFDLTTIPRASTMTCPSDFIAGSAETVSITRKSTNFTHTASCSLGNTGLSATSGINTSFTYTPPLSLFNSKTYESSTKRTGTISVQTKSGTTDIGSSLIKDINVILPENENTKPTCSIIGDLEEYETSFLDKYGVLIAGRSKLKTTCSSSAKLAAQISKKYASMKGGTVSISGDTITTSALTTDANKGVISYYVKDTRGFTSKTSTITNPYLIVEYKKPFIISFDAIRVNSDTGKEDPVKGTKLKFKIEYYCDPIAVSDSTPSGGKTIPNSANITIWQLTSDDLGNLSRTQVLSGLASDILNNNHTNIIDGDFSINNSYTFEASITDDITVTPASMGKGIRTYARTAQTLMSFRQGDGITVGRIADTSGFNVAMDSSFEKNVSIGNATFTYDYMAKALKITFLE